MNLPFLLCLILRLAGAIYIEPLYLSACTTRVEFQTTCNYYRYNDINCFPWAIRNCSIMRVEEYAMCSVHDCVVRILLSAYFCLSAFNLKSKFFHLNAVFVIKILIDIPFFIYLRQFK